MGAVVEWTSPHNSKSNVTYTARYLLRNEKIYLCMNTKELKCDAGKLPFAFGSYIFQVRAEDQGLFSEWVNTSEFAPNKHTSIGPPSVYLVIRNNTLDVLVRDPVLKIKKLAEIYSKVSYIIKYWTEGFEDMVTEKKINKEDQEDDVKWRIKGLNLWSRYCVTACVVPKGYRNKPEFSSAVCVSNTPVLTSCVIAAAILLPLVILAAWLAYKGKRFLYPKIKVPDSITNPFVPSFLTVEPVHHTPHEKEQHDKISAISEDHLHEELSEKTKNTEDKVFELLCDHGPIQEMEEDYKLLNQMQPAPTFYPNHLYPLCTKNTLFTHLNPPRFASSTGNQHYYCNLAATNSDLKRTNCAF
ncbi:cytokine receptor family member B15 [Xyrauchen texanus]|uniref:cytokine receptor family member B15 n=1 Tax=Xyrauchen texanus TaxID=154827 RepID=UPI00224234D3|nr:cytokine receptor family member B15 [Xyrauchen texanus]